MSHFSAPGKSPLLQGVYQANSTTTCSLAAISVASLPVLIHQEIKLGSALLMSNLIPLVMFGKRECSSTYNDDVLAISAFWASEFAQWRLVHRPGFAASTRRLAGV